MSNLKLVIAPDPILHKASKEVQDFGPSFQSFVDDFVKTMYVEDGAGLAGVQVGVLKRIMAVDVSSYEGKENKNLYVIVNPEVLFYSDEQWIKEEGCLSFPGVRVKIARPYSIKIKYQDRYGKEQELEAEDWFARAILHELDHLNGVTMVDRLSPFKRDLVMKKLQKLKRNKAL